MAAAMSAGSGGTLRRRDDVPSSRIAELWCTGRWERDGAAGCGTRFGARSSAP